MSTVRIMHVSCCTCQSATPTQQFFLSLKIVVCSDAFFDDFSLLYLTFPLRVCLGSMQVSPDCTRCEWTQLNCAALLIAMLLRKAQNTTSSVNMWCFFFFSPRLFLYKILLLSQIKTSSTNTQSISTSIDRHPHHAVHCYNWSRGRKRGKRRRAEGQKLLILFFFCSNQRLALALFPHIRNQLQPPCHHIFFEAAPSC